MSEQRRLAAILVADVVGYSKLVGSDEAKTLAALQTLRSSVIEPAIAKYPGRLFKAVGDGFLVEFASAVQAVEAALAIQEAAAEGALPLRIGIHVGDVVVQGDDLMGDGVNISARIEGVAEPGGIAISREVHAQVRDKLDLDFEDRGEIALKNLARPIHVFSIAGSKPRVATAPALALPDKPSIAVLPFQNMSGDPEQEYFTDGVTEDIITELSRFHELFVIARNSSFTYKGKAVDVRTVATELGVRYVLEGSIRKASNRIRVTGQLIDATSGAHIWAERYDRVLEDVFAVQEELTKCIVAAIAPFVSEAEVERTRRRRPESLSAYEIAVRARAKAWDAYIKSDQTLRDEAIGEARAALVIDARSALALNALALAQFHQLMFATPAAREMAWQDGMAAATKSIDVDRAGGFGHTCRGLLLAFGHDSTRIDEGLAGVRLGHELNPHDMLSLLALANVENIAGDPESGLTHVQQALRISPRDPLRGQMHQMLAQASLGLGRYADGVDYALLAIGDNPHVATSHVILAENYVGLGEIKKAQASLQEARRLGPAYVEIMLEKGLQYRKPEHLRRVTAFLRIAAGLEDPSVAEALR